MRSEITRIVALVGTLILTGCMAPSGGRSTPGPKLGAGQCPEKLDLAAAPKGSWLEVKAIMIANCKSCHPTYIDYAKVKPKIKDIVRMTALKISDKDFMPQGKKKALVAADLKALTLWQKNGTPNSAPTGSEDDDADDEDVPPAKKPECVDPTP